MGRGEGKKETGVRQSKKRAKMAGRTRNLAVFVADLPCPKKIEKISFALFLFGFQLLKIRGKTYSVCLVGRGSVVSAATDVITSI